MEVNDDATDARIQLPANHITRVNNLMNFLADPTLTKGRNAAESGR